MSRIMMSAERFLKDVCAHTLEVKKDDGLYRHLSFRGPKPNSWNMWFEIVTWPENLTIHGDMGTWSFSRIADMFEFFRSSSLKINASYWAEKITSESRFGGPHKKFHPEQFKVNVLRCVEDECDLEEPEKATVIAALEAEVFGEECEVFARKALSEFDCDGFEFTDAYEIDGDDCTYHYLWCLHAIVWGIGQYDDLRATARLA